MQFRQQLFNMLACGGIYALTALGYTLVFGVVRLVNFAHCDVMMLGAYAGWLMRSYFDVPLWLLFPCVMLFCAFTGLLIQRAVYRPLFRVREEYLLIAAVGVSLVLEYGIAGLFGSAPKRLYLPQLGGTVSLFGWNLPLAAAFAFFICLLCMALLTLFLRCTKTGLAMRAVSEDAKAAKLCGISENAMVGAAFFVGSALAGVSGVLYGHLYSLTPFMGAAPGLKAFAAAVVGGIGSIPGAVLGGFLLSFFETAASLAFGSGVRDGVSFLAMILTLLLFPGGLLRQGKGSDRF